MMPEQVRRLPRALLAALALVLASCATTGLLERAAGDFAADASARELAAGGFHDWLVLNDPVRAARRFADAVARDGRDPWARLGAAMLARRSLEDQAEASHLLALVEAAPRHPLAAPAVRRLGELAELSPQLGRAVEAGLGHLQQGGALDGLVALRARTSRSAAGEGLGDHALVARLHAEAGSVGAWTLAGPYGAFQALDFDRSFPPESGVLPRESPGPPGLAPVVPRILPCPEGIASLDGEPPGGDVYYLAAELRVTRGGEYLVAVGGTVSLRAFLDGEPVAERRAFAGFPAGASVVARTLSPGAHHLLVKVSRGTARAQIAVSVARADGRPSDATASPATPGAAMPAVRPGPLPAPVNLARGLAARLEPEMGPEVARLVAARDALEGDREASKALLEEALALRPGSAALLSARGDAHRDDATLAEKTARARAEGAYDRALVADPGDAATRLQRADLMRAEERLDDAWQLLAGLPEAGAGRPRALVARARTAWARGFAEGAEMLAEEARRLGEPCEALELLHELATRREAIGRADELAEALSRCRGGRQRLLDHRRQRGDAAGAVALAEQMAARFPSRIEPRLALAQALVTAGEPRRAVRELEELSRIWPRDARIHKRRADVLDAAGEPGAARAARERALALHPGDLALRRALGLDAGREPLDDLAESGEAALREYRAAAPRHDTSSTTVLDAGAIEAHPGGAHLERVHELVHVRDQRAVERYGELSVPAGAEILVIRTLKPDGRVLEAEEGPGEKRTVSLPGLEPGDFAEWEWLRAIPARGPGVPGFTSDAFYFRGDVPLWRSTYVVAAPLGEDLEVDAHHMPAPKVEVEGERKVLRIQRTNVPPLLPEPGAPAESEYAPFVQVGSGATQEEFARAMADGIIGSFRPSLEVRALAREVAAAVPEGLRTGEALARAAYARVCELVLGQGGSFTEGASQILSRGRGSRTVLLKALLDALGVHSRLALVREFSRDPATFRFPRPELWGYAILRVELGAKVAWLDPTARLNPFGVLPGAVRGAKALVLPEPGEQPRSERTPEDDGRELRETRLAIALAPDGSAVVEGVERYQGYEAAIAKASIERLDAQARRQAVEQALSRSFRGPALEQLSLEGEASADLPLTMRYRVRVAEWARLEDGRAVVDAALHPARLGARFLQRASRETPLLVGASERGSLRVEISLPEGLAPSPSPPAEISSDFGRYRRVERAEPGMLVREDAFELRASRVAPGDYHQFARFASAVDEAQAAPMVFRSATPADDRPARPGG